MRLEAVILPDLGTGPDVPIIVSHWFASRGDEVWEGDRLVEVLVGPATFDVPAPVTGRLVEICGQEDDPVRPGSVLGRLKAMEGGDGDARNTSPGPSPDMTTIHERSAGVIPYRFVEDQGLLYLVLHSATVRNPRAKWEFPKGGMEVGESTRETAAREFQEETGLTDWSFRDDFERSLSYTYIRRGRKVIKTVTYYVVEVHDVSRLARSDEHVEDPFGHWCYWGTFEQISRLLYHAKIRQVFGEVHEWLSATR